MSTRPRLTTQEGIQHPYVVEARTAGPLHGYPRPLRPLLEGPERIPAAAVEPAAVPSGFDLREELLWDVRVALRLLRQRRRRLEVALHATASRDRETM